MYSGEIVKTIKAASEFKFKERGSVFISSVFPSSDQKQAEEYLKITKKKFYDASHNCYAYRIFNSDVKHSDDGEPSGSAGIRILNAVQRFDVFNLLVIVTRYFGGVKLGIGPLGKAYYHSAFEAIRSSKIVENQVYSQIRVSFEFDQTKNVHHFLNRFEAADLQNYYDEIPSIECKIRNEAYEILCKTLSEISKGKIDIQLQKENILLPKT